MIIFLKTIGWVLLIVLEFMIVAISTALISSGDFQTNRKDDLSEGQMRIYLEIFEQIEKTIYRRYK